MLNPFVQPNQPAYNSDEVTVMFWQDNTYLWMGNSYGTTRLHRQEKSIQTFPDLQCLQPLLSKDPLLTKGPETVWCGGYRFDGTAWYQAENIAPPIQAHNGIVWSSNSSSILLFNETAQEWQVVLQDTGTKSPVQIFSRAGLSLDFEAQDGALWFHGDYDFSGINRWTLGSHCIWHHASTDYAMIPRFETKNGEVFATAYPPYSNNLGFWDGHEWEWLQVFEKMSTHPDFLEEKDGTIWIVTVEIGRWNRESWQMFTPFPNELQAEYIYQSSNDDIWVTVFHKPIHNIGRWDGKTWQTWGEEQLLHPSEECNNLASVGTTLKPQNGFENTMIGKAINPKYRYFVEDNNHHLWIVHANSQGVGRWTGDCWRHYTINDGLSSNDVTVLTFSPDGVLWSGTGDAGINYYHPETDQWIPFPFE